MKSLKSMSFEEKFLKQGKLFVIIFALLSIMRMWAAVMEIQPRNTVSFDEASRQGQGCYIDCTYISETVGTNTAYPDAHFRFLEDENGLIFLALMDDAIFKECREKEEDVITIYGYAAELNDKYAASALKYAYGYAGIDENNIRGVIGDYQFFISREVRLRREFWLKVVIVADILLVGCVVYVFVQKRLRERKQDDIKKGKHAVIIGLLIAVICSFGYSSGWGLMAFLLMVSTGIMDRYAPKTPEIGKFVFRTTFIFYAIAMIASNFIFSYLRSMARSFKGCFLSYGMYLRMLVEVENYSKFIFVGLIVFFMFIGYAILKTVCKNLYVQKEEQSICKYTQINEECADSEKIAKTSEL